MSKGQFITLTLLLAVAVAAGAVVGSLLNPVHAVSAQELRLVPSPATGAAIVTPSFADLAEQAIPSVVLVRNETTRPADPHASIPNLRRFFGGPFNQEGKKADPRRGFQLQGTGAGFFVSKDGFLLTNKHVVEKAERLRIDLSDGERLDAKLIGIDPALDIALLKVEADRDFPALPLGDSDGLRVGEWVVAIGNPVGFNGSVTVGVVSGKGRRLDFDPNNLSSYIQTDAAINFGNSGGPLINARGEVVGISTAIMRGNTVSPIMGMQKQLEGLGFALPISKVTRVLDQLAKTGTVRRGYLGVTIADVDEDAAEWGGLGDAQGALVTDVAPDRPAARAGVEAGDVIRKVNGKTIAGRDELVQSISSLLPDETVRLGIWRKGKELDIDVTLTERPAGPIDERGPQAEEADPETEEAVGLGFTVRPMPQSMKDDGFGGLLIYDVDPASSAYEKGVRPGGILTDVNGTPIRTVADYREALRDVKAGAVVRISISDSSGATAMIFFRAPSAGSE